MTGQCVGFADCPCVKCRATRQEKTAAHPDHGHASDRSYCGACRTAELNRYSSRGAELLRSVTRSQTVVWTPESGWTA